MLNAHPQPIVFQEFGEGDVVTRPISFKTPGRSVKRSRVVHDENSVYGHPNFTGKKKTNFLKTPGPGTELKSHLLTTGKGLGTASKSAVLSEITNRTPFIKGNNVGAPPSTRLKSSKSFVVFEETTVEPSPRISSTRKSLRLPRASKTFETPEVSGNPWDVSDECIEASLQDDASEEQEDSSEIEYMPPTATEPPYEPEFEMPDYRQVGQNIKSLFRCMSISDAESSSPIPKLFDEDNIPTFDYLYFPDLSDDSVSPYAPRNPRAPHSLTPSSSIKQTPLSGDLSRIPKPSSTWSLQTHSFISRKPTPQSRIPVPSRPINTHPPHSVPAQRSLKSNIHKSNIHKRGVSMFVAPESAKGHFRSKTLSQKALVEQPLSRMVNIPSRNLKMPTSVNQLEDKKEHQHTTDDDAFGLATKETEVDFVDDDFLFTL